MYDEQQLQQEHLAQSQAPLQAAPAEATQEQAQIDNNASAQEEVKQPEQPNQADKAPA